MGHPRGLATLFFTEMWERLSYYGMRGLLILFLVDTLRGGYGLDDKTAAAIYGLYTASVYLLAVPGGWLADRILGQRTAVFWGGVLIACGHFSMAVGPVALFYLGLTLIALGTGLLKPNVSAMVGDLYPEGGARRDAGFSVFYMGINLGATIGPLLCSYFGEKINWHLGFAVAGVGMVFGLIQYRLGARHLGTAGELRGVTPAQRSAAISTAGKFGLFVLALGGVVAALHLMGIYLVNPQGIASVMSVSIPFFLLAYFAYQFLFGGFDAAEKKRLAVVLILCAASAVFWGGYEQAGSSLNLFAMRATDLFIFGYEIPAGWIQSLPAVFVILLAPVFGWLWIKLEKHEPSVPAKFAYGLAQLALSFFVMAWAGTFVTQAFKVSIMWLVVTNFLATGELCLSPVGLSGMTKLAPRKIVGQMMGMWFLATSLGNLLAGMAAGYTEALGYVQLFSLVGAVVMGAAVLLGITAPPIRKLMGGVE